MPTFLVRLDCEDNRCERIVSESSQKVREDVDEYIVVVQRGDIVAVWFGLSPCAEHHSSTLAAAWTARVEYHR